MKLFRIVALAIILIGTIISATFLWNFIDIFMIILAVINTYAIFKLRKDVFKECDKYVKIK
jgi:Na+/alanine symporter